jgi:hypothetical protein
MALQKSKVKREALEDFGKKILKEQDSLVHLKTLQDKFRHGCVSVVSGYQNIFLKTSQLTSEHVR